MDRYGVLSLLLHTSRISLTLGIGNCHALGCVLFSFSTFDFRKTFPCFFPRISFPQSLHLHVCSVIKLPSFCLVRSILTYSVFSCLHSNLLIILMLYSFLRIIKAPISGCTKLLGLLHNIILKNQKRKTKRKEVAVTLTPDNETRTHDTRLIRPLLYQLSYVR